MARLIVKTCHRDFFNEYNDKSVVDILSSSVRFIKHISEYSIIHIYLKNDLVECYSRSCKLQFSPATTEYWLLPGDDVMGMIEEKVFRKLSKLMIGIVKT
jgi:hypothetical protein